MDRETGAGEDAGERGIGWQIAFHAFALDAAHGAIGIDQLDAGARGIKIERARKIAAGMLKSCAAADVASTSASAAPAAVDFR